RTRTSPLRGGSTSISTICRGFPASKATAARDFINKAPIWSRPNDEYSDRCYPMRPTGIGALIFIQYLCNLCILFPICVAASLGRFCPNPICADAIFLTPFLHRSGHCGPPPSRQNPLHRASTADPAGRARRAELFLVQHQFTRRPLSA